jgi:hypothetical protein
VKTQMKFSSESVRCLFLKNCISNNFSASKGCRFYKTADIMQTLIHKMLVEKLNKIVT